jgi:nickel-dependent lactate racemase
MIDERTQLAAVELPWGAWYGDAVHRLPLPADWQIDVLAPADAPALSAPQIEHALAEPIDSRPLEELAAGGRSACIVVDDLARPTRSGDVLPTLVHQLRDGGIPQEHITVLVATGTHGGVSAEQLRKKLTADAVDEPRVEVHDAAASTVETDLPYGKQPLRINRTFLEADVKLGVGCVLPHSFAGYSGGAKLLLPGLADVAATARSHKFVQMGLRGGSDPNENRFRREIEDLARQLGLNYTVCVVTNSRRETAGVFAGDLVAAHRRACRMAAEVYATPVRDTYDCLMLGTYPKDVDLIQAENALVALKNVGSPLVHERGVVLLATAASEGIGRHGLFSPGGASYQPPKKKRALGGRELWLYAPGVTESEARQLVWDGYPFFADAEQLGEALGRRFPGGARAGVLPCAPSQQVDDQRTISDSDNA